MHSVWLAAELDRQCPGSCPAPMTPVMGQVRNHSLGSIRLFWTAVDMETPVAGVRGGGCTAPLTPHTPFGPGLVPASAYVGGQPAHRGKPVTADLLDRAGNGLALTGPAVG